MQLLLVTSKPVSQHAGGTWLWINFTSQTCRSPSAHPCPRWISLFHFFYPFLPPIITRLFQGKIFLRPPRFRNEHSYFHFLRFETGGLTVLFDSFIFSFPFFFYQKVRWAERLQFIKGNCSKVYGENSVNWRGALDFREISYKLVEKAVGKKTEGVEGSERVLLHPAYVASSPPLWQIY